MRFYAYMRLCITAILASLCVGYGLKPWAVFNGFMFILYCIDSICDAIKEAKK